MLTKVRLFAITRTVDGLGSGADNVQKLIAYCARVSNPDNQNKHETAEKLLKYLMKNGHWSPFEMVSATMEITTTRDIARQILRHWSFKFQEFSQRYGQATSFSDPKTARMQDSKNRQSSIKLDMTDANDIELNSEWELKQTETLDMARRNYEWALSHGIAKEVARVVLPEGLTMSKLYMAGTIRSWIHYIAERTKEGVQLEHREIAIACAEALRAELDIKQLS